MKFETVAQVEERTAADTPGTQPQPERHEPRLEEPGLTRLSFADWKAILVRAGKGTLSDNVPTLASALAYSAFLAIPSLLLAAVGVFSLVAGPGAVQTIVDKLGQVIPRDATRLLDDSLTRVTQAHAGTGIALVLIGLVLAVWSLTSAMGTLMWALNLAYGRQDKRSFGCSTSGPR